MAQFDVGYFVKGVERRGKGQNSLLGGLTCRCLSGLSVQSGCPVLMAYFCVIMAYMMVVHTASLYVHEIHTSVKGRFYIGPFAILASEQNIVHRPATIRLPLLCRSSLGLEEPHAASVCFKSLTSCCVT